MAEKEGEIFPKGLPESDSLGDQHRDIESAIAKRTRSRLAGTTERRTVRERPVNIAKAKRAEKLATVRGMGDELRSSSPLLPPGNPRPLGHALRPEYLAGFRRRRPTS